jgi:hypothetical protein
MCARTHAYLILTHITHHIEVQIDIAAIDADETVEQNDFGWKKWNFEKTPAFLLSHNWLCASC